MILGGDWGCDRKGKNMLGKILMEVRENFRLRLDWAKTLQEIHQLLPIFQVGHVFTLAHLHILAFHILPVPLSHNYNRREAGESCVFTDASPYANHLV